MNWLITGGCGFIGVNLNFRLRQEGGHGIRVVDSLEVGTQDDLSKVSPVEIVDKDIAPPTLTADDPTQLICGDIRDPALAVRMGQGIDCIVHLAANTGVLPSVEDPWKDLEANVIGTFNYLESARTNKISCFVTASSGATIGEVTPPVHEMMPARPMSPYGASKVASEAYCSAFFHSYGVKTVALRFGNVYGPRSSHKGSVVAKFIRQILAGETLVVYGDGTQTRDFIYVEDLVDAVKSATQKDVGGHVFQIATNRETTLSEMVDILIRICATRDLSVNVQHASTRKGEIQRNFSDTTKAEDMLNWKSRVELSEGLERTVEWFESLKSD